MENQSTITKNKKSLLKDLQHEVQKFELGIVNGKCTRLILEFTPVIFLVVITIIMLIISLFITIIINVIFIIWS